MAEDYKLIMPYQYKQMTLYNNKRIMLNEYKQKMSKRCI